MIEKFSDLGRGRGSYVLERITKSDKILEIGGSYNPTFRKDQGYNLWTSDHDTKANLQMKYGKGPTWEMSANIQDVDFVATDGNLETVVPQEHFGTFDFVFSSHAIEHIPNPIAHLASVKKMLAEGGTYLMVAPDKRGTYDLLRPLTTAGNWLDAFFRAEPFHSPRAIYDNGVYSLIHNDLVTWYPPKAYGRLHLSPTPIDEAFSAARAHKEFYQDAHAWNFTPNSMLLILRELHNLAVTDLYPTRVISDGGQEFLVELTKTDIRTKLGDEERLALLIAACKEQAIVHMDLPHPKGDNSSTHRGPSTRERFYQSPLLHRLIAFLKSRNV